MQKAIYIFAVLLALVLVFIGYKKLNKPEIINLDSTGSTIVAFGDSLVEGVGATEDHDFVTLLSRRVGEPILNLGMRGDTTASALERVDQVLAKDPKIVIMLLGGNDYLRRVPMDETFANLGMIIDKIHANGSAVLLLGVRGGILRDTYEDRFRKFAKAKKVGFVPNVLDDLIGNREYMSDSIHPNDRGYEIIAERVEKILKEMIEDNRRLRMEL